MELKDLDLNLLVVFQQLMRTGRVSGAAETLGLSQPAVSASLARLRTALGDELFVRTGRGMRPTPHAQALAEPIEQALAAIHATLNRRAEFDPAEGGRAFSIALSDIGELYFLPTLMKRLDVLAPGVGLDIVRASGTELRDALASGTPDLAIGAHPELQAGFFQRRLFDQPYVCLMRADHPLAQGRFDRDAFEAAEHAAVASTPGSAHARLDALLEATGARRRVRLRVPHFVALSHVLAVTDLIASVPEKFAQRHLAPFGLAMRPHPVELPRIRIAMHWHARFHREPGNRWLRALVADTFGE